MTTGRKRGRPKGTGIKDNETLLKIACIIVANPTMKRTTAIKKLGITNPSIIRRLRDKFADQEQRLLSEARGMSGGDTGPDANRAKARPRRPGDRPAMPQGAAGDRKTDGPSAHSMADLSPHALAADIIAIRDKVGNAGAPLELIGQLLGGLNIETLVTQFIGQVLGMDAKTLKSSPITALISEQARMIDMILPLLQMQMQAQAAQAQQGARVA